MSHEEFDCEGKGWYSGLQRQEELLSKSFVEHGGHAGRERSRRMHSQQRLTPRLCQGLRWERLWSRNWNELRDVCRLAVCQPDTDSSHGNREHRLHPIAFKQFCDTSWLMIDVEGGSVLWTVPALDSGTGLNKKATPLYGLCFSSCLQASALLEFLSWLHSMIDCDQGMQAKWTFKLLLVPMFVTAIERELEQEFFST